MIGPPDIETMTEEQLRASLSQRVIVCAQQNAEIARLVEVRKKNCCMNIISRIMIRHRMLLTL